MLGIPRRTIHLYPGELMDLLRTARLSPDEGSALVAAFEDAFTRHLGVRHAIPVGAGRLGLKLCLEGLGVGHGDGVMLPALTDESVPSAIRRTGAEPVYVDVDRQTHNLDPALLESAMRPHVKAIIATHIFGAPCDMAAVSAFAEKHGLAVLEDCAHAIDASSAGRRCGTMGDAAIFSFVVTKAVNTFGGGMVATDDDALAARVRKAVNALPLPDPVAMARRVLAGYALNAVTRPNVFGWLGLPALAGLKAAGSDVVGAYNTLVRPSTINAHVDNAFSPIQAAAGLQQLRDLSDTQRRRHAIADAITAALPAHMQRQKPIAGDVHAWYFFVATSEQPDAIAAQLLARNVDVGRHPMRNVAALDDPAGGPVEFPAAQYVYDHALQLPVHPTLGPDAVTRLVRAVSSVEDP